MEDHRARRAWYELNRLTRLDELIMLNEGSPRPQGERRVRTTTRFERVGGAARAESAESTKRTRGVSRAAMSQLMLHSYHPGGS